MLGARTLTQSAAGPESAAIIYKQGELIKQGGSRGVGWKTWKKRWFVLSEAGVAYYESEKAYRQGQKEKGFIANTPEDPLEIADIPEAAADDTSKEHLFLFRTAHRTMLVRAQDAQIKQQWLGALSHSVSHNRGEVAKLEQLFTAALVAQQQQQQQLQQQQLQQQQLEQLKFALSPSAMPSSSSVSTSSASGGQASVLTKTNSYPAPNERPALRRDSLLGGAMEAAIVNMDASDNSDPEGLSDSGSESDGTSDDERDTESAAPQGAVRIGVSVGRLNRASSQSDQSSTEIHPSSFSPNQSSDYKTDTPTTVVDSASTFVAASPSSSDGIGSVNPQPAHATDESAKGSGPTPTGFAVSPQSVDFNCAPLSRSCPTSMDANGSSGEDQSSEVTATVSTQTQSPRVRAHSSQDAETHTTQKGAEGQTDTSSASVSSEERLSGAGNIRPAASTNPVGKPPRPMTRFEKNRESMRKASITELSIPETGTTEALSTSMFSAPRGSVVVIGGGGPEDMSNVSMSGSQVPFTPRQSLAKAGPSGSSSTSASDALSRTPLTAKTTPVGRSHVDHPGKVHFRSIYEGYLEKRGAAPGSKWKRRYFALFPDRIEYFDDHKSRRPNGTIELLATGITGPLHDDLTPMKKLPNRHVSDSAVPGSPALSAKDSEPCQMRRNASEAILDSRLLGQEDPVSDLNGNFSLGPSAHDGISQANPSVNLANVPQGRFFWHVTPTVGGRQFLLASNSPEDRLAWLAAIHYTRTIQVTFPPRVVTQPSTAQTLAAVMQHPGHRAALQGLAKNLGLSMCLQFWIDLAALASASSPKEFYRLASDIVELYIRPQLTGPLTSTPTNNRQESQSKAQQQQHSGDVSNSLSARLPPDVVRQLVNAIDTAEANQSPGTLQVTPQMFEPIVSIVEHKCCEDLLAPFLALDPGQVYDLAEEELSRTSSVTDYASLSFLLNYLTDVTGLSRSQTEDNANSTYAALLSAVCTPAANELVPATLSVTGAPDTMSEAEALELLQVPTRPAQPSICVAEFKSPRLSLSHAFNQMSSNLQVSRAYSGPIPPSSSGGSGIQAGSPTSFTDASWVPGTPDHPALSVPPATSLANLNSEDLPFRKAFLLNLHVFATPAILATHLVDTFEMAEKYHAAAGPSSELLTLATRLRVVTIVGEWLNSYPEDFVQNFAGPNYALPQPTPAMLAALHSPNEPEPSAHMLERFSAYPRYGTRDLLRRMRRWYSACIVAAGASAGEREVSLTDCIAKVDADTPAYLLDEEDSPANPPTNAEGEKQASTSLEDEQLVAKVKAQAKCWRVLEERAERELAVPLPTPWSSTPSSPLELLAHKLYETLLQPIPAPKDSISEDELLRLMKLAAEARQEKDKYELKLEEDARLAAQKEIEASNKCPLRDRVFDKSEGERDNTSADQPTDKPAEQTSSARRIVNSLIGFFEGRTASTRVTITSSVSSDTKAQPSQSTSTCDTKQSDICEAESESTVRRKREMLLKSSHSHSDAGLRDRRCSILPGPGLVKRLAQKYAHQFSDDDCEGPQASTPSQPRTPIGTNVKVGITEDNAPQSAPEKIDLPAVSTVRTPDNAQTPADPAPPTPPSSDELMGLGFDKIDKYDNDEEDDSDGDDAHSKMQHRTSVRVPTVSSSNAPSTKTCASEPDMTPGHSSVESEAKKDASCKLDASTDKTISERTAQIASGHATKLSTHATPSAGATNGTEKPPQKEINFVSYPPKRVAIELTRVDYEMLSRISLREFVAKTWIKSPSSAPNLCGMIASFNARSQWVASLILTRPDSASRLSALKWTIDLAYECYSLHNFHSTFAIFSGLGMSQVYRLKQDWAKLPSSTSSKMEQLRAFTDSSRNFRAYRTLFKSALGRPQIPHLAVICKDCFQVEEMFGNRKQKPTPVASAQQVRLLALDRYSSRARYLSTYNQFHKSNSASSSRPLALAASHPATATCPSIASHHVFDSVQIHQLDVVSFIRFSQQWQELDGFYLCQKSAYVFPPVTDSQLLSVLRDGPPTLSSAELWELSYKIEPKAGTCPLTGK